MKKIASLILSLVLLLGLAVPALASQMPSTRVTYTAASTQGSYYVDVPNTLDIETANSGTVKAWGTWGATEKLTVTTDPTVQLTCTSDTGAEPVSAVVSLGTTNWSGRATARTESEACSAPISVAFDDTHPAPAAGEWTGTITYNVSCNPATITGLSVKTQPTVKYYLPDETFDPTGIELQFTYDNGATEDLTDAQMDAVTYSNTDLSQATGGAMRVTATYNVGDVNVSTSLDWIQVWVDSGCPLRIITTAEELKEVAEAIHTRQTWPNQGVVVNNSTILEIDDLVLGTEQRPFRGSYDAAYPIRGLTFGYLGTGADIDWKDTDGEQKTYSKSLIGNISGDVTLNIALHDATVNGYLIDTVSSGTVTIKVICDDVTFSEEYLIRNVAEGATVNIVMNSYFGNTNITAGTLKASGGGTVNCDSNVYFDS